jgi:hypothetical protein
MILLRIPDMRYLHRVTQVLVYVGIGVNFVADVALLRGVSLCLRSTEFYCI